jgi:hypothetical protein
MRELVDPSRTLIKPFRSYSFDDMDIRRIQCTIWLLPKDEIENGSSFDRGRYVDNDGEIEPCDAAGMEFWDE